MASRNQNAGWCPELRQDPITNRWVIFSPARAKRPTGFTSKNPQNSNPNNNSSCPFCFGNEHECAPEIFRVPPDLNDPNWKFRVIAFSRNLECLREEKQDMEFPSRVIGGFGFHDVVIKNPVDSFQLCDMEAREIVESFFGYKKRIQQIMSVESIKYVQVFKNHGASARASMSHSHSQILALLSIPPSVSARLEGIIFFILIIV